MSTEANRFEEAPVLTDAAAYTFPTEGRWTETAGGAGLLAIHPGGQTALTFTEVAQRPLGCDGLKQDLALLTGKGMRPGPVWLLPAQSTDARSLPFSTTATAEEKVWGIDGVELSLVKTDIYTAELRVAETVLKTIDTSKVMDGFEVTPIDLTEFTIFADEVVGAWMLPDVGRVAVTRWPSFEGAHYDLILLDRAEHRAAESLYLCAF